MFTARLQELPPEEEMPPGQQPQIDVEVIQQPKEIRTEFVPPIADTIRPAEPETPVTLNTPPALPIARVEFERKTQKRVEEFEGNVTATHGPQH